MSLYSIRLRYDVPVYVGRRVSFEGRLGTVIGARDQYVRIRLDGELRAGSYHPLWHIDWLDGVDHGAAYDRRVEAFNAGLSRGATSGRPRDDAGGSGR